MTKGKILWFNDKKGFGLAKSEDKEIFIHHSQIVTSSNNYKILYQDEEVEFEVYEDKGKTCAKNVKASSGKFKFELNNVQQKKKKKKRKPKNTENFNPSHKPTDARVVVGNPHSETYGKNILSRDMIYVPELLCKENDMTIYNKLLEEVKKTGKEEEGVWKLWHGDTHMIADDHLKWKQDCPTFNMIIEKLEKYFNMDIKATRLNWYQNSDHWKPYHHDAAAVKPHIAKIQNLTMAVSFGLERDASFEHAKTKTTVSMPQPNGSVYGFARDTNVIWKHGILQVDPKKRVEKGRISIIAWGYAKQIDV